MQLISFDCKHCGAPLEVPVNAVAVICQFCKSQHKVAFEDGVLIAELVRTVDQHGEQIADLESGSQITNEVLKAMQSLKDAEEALAKFDESYDDVDANAFASLMMFFMSVIGSGLLIFTPLSYPRSWGSMPPNGLISHFLEFLAACKWQMFGFLAVVGLVSLFFFFRARP